MLSLNKERKAHNLHVYESFKICSVERGLCADLATTALALCFILSGSAKLIAGVGSNSLGSRIAFSEVLLSR